jgi:hypothetical protein
VLLDGFAFSTRPKYRVQFVSMKQRPSLKLWGRLQPTSSICFLRIFILRVQCGQMAERQPYKHLIASGDSMSLEDRLLLQAMKDGSDQSVPTDGATLTIFCASLKQGSRWKEV